MYKSLEFEDRDMFVSRVDDSVSGYIIAQPISPLIISNYHAHFNVGIIDDFYHSAFSDSAYLVSDATPARDLVAAAESAFARRKKTAALIVCPAAWTSKRKLLESEGYEVIKMWMIKRLQSERNNAAKR